MGKSSTDSDGIFKSGTQMNGANICHRNNLSCNIAIELERPEKKSSPAALALGLLIRFCRRLFLACKPSQKDGEVSRMLESYWLKTLVRSVAFFAIFLLCHSSFGQGTDIADSSQPVVLKTLSLHSRLSISVDPGVKTTWKNTKKGFEVLFHGLSMVDLGAVFGSERNWATQFSHIGDQRLSRIQLKDTPDGVKLNGEWKFPQGKDRLAFEEMKYFEYRRKEPPAFVIDFWHKPGPTLAAYKNTLIQNRKNAALRVAQKKAKARVKRRIEKKKRHLAAADVTDYCRLPLSEKRDTIIPFRPAKAAIKFRNWFSGSTPDSNYPYSYPTKKGKDAKYVRNTIEFYYKGKFGLVNRAIKFLEDEYPHSEYLVEMRFLRANALFRLGYVESAEQIFREIFINYGKTPVAIHAGNYLVSEAFESKNHLKALEYFLSLLRSYPDHRLAWVYHLGAAETMASLGQREEAREHYQWVIDRSPDRKARSQASFRIGDLYMARRQYSQALASYYKAIERFPKEAKKYAAVLLNKAESLYWLGQYDRAKTEFDKFLKIYPTHPDGWRASYRISEIYDRKKGKSYKKQGQDWLLKTINRYPYGAGATLARLRLLTCPSHGGFNYTSAERYFERVRNEFDPEEELFDERYLDYFLMSHVRTRIAMEREGEAIELIASTLQKPVQKTTKTDLTKSFKKVFRQWIMKLLDGGEKYAAVNAYSKYSWIINDEDKKIIPDFLSRLSRAASDLELGSLAVRLMNQYQNIKSHQNRDRKIAKVDDMDVDQRVERSEEYYSESKALWVADGIKSEGKIRKNLEQISAESQHSYKAEIIRSLLDGETGNFENALHHAAKAQLLVSRQSKEFFPPLAYWIVHLQRKTNQLDAAIESIDQLYNFLKTNRKPAAEKAKAEKTDRTVFSTLLALGLPGVIEPSALLMEKAEILEQQGKWGKAAGVYSLVIKEGLDNNRTNFAYARALEKQGDLKGWKVALKKIAKSKQNDFWKRLAQEALGEKEE